MRFNRRRFKPVFRSVVFLPWGPRQAGTAGEVAALLERRPWLPYFSGEALTFVIRHIRHLVPLRCGSCLDGPDTVGRIPGFPDRRRCGDFRDGPPGAPRPGRKSGGGQLVSRPKLHSASVGCHRSSIVCFPCVRMVILSQGSR
jgi:hypothetical protein